MRMMDFEGRTGAVAYIHQQIGGTLSHLDSKATIYSGIATGALVYLAQRKGLAVVLDVLKQPQTILPTFAGTDYLLAGTAFVAALMFVASFAFASQCLWPRDSGKTDSVIYFHGVAARSSAVDYATEISNLDEHSLAKNLSLDTFYLARIARKKMRNVQLSSLMLFLGAIALVISEFTRLYIQLSV